MAVVPSSSRGSGSGSQTVVAGAPLTLLAADLLAIADTPVKILDAPGAGKAIAIMFASGQYLPGSTPFGEDPGFKFAIGPSLVGGHAWQGYDDLFQTGQMQTLNPTLDFDPQLWMSGPPDTGAWENTAIYVTATVNMTLGDGSVILTPFYILIDVA